MNHFPDTLTQTTLCPPLIHGTHDCVCRDLEMSAGIYSNEALICGHGAKQEVVSKSLASLRRGQHQKHDELHANFDLYFQIFWRAGRFHTLNAAK